LPRPSATRPAPTVALAAAALLFGSTFLVVKDAVEEVGVVPFLAARFLVAAATLAPLAHRRPRAPGVLRAGTLAGVALAGGYLFQTFGLRSVSSSVSAFITYLLVVFVPVLSAALLRRRPRATTVAGIVLATAGLALLTGGGVGLGTGELLTLGCAVLFAVHIVLLADFAPRHDTVTLNLVQLAVVGAALAVPGLFGGGYHFPPGVWLAVAYTGVVVTAAAFMLQVWGQRAVGPARTALVLLLEPVFAALLGYLAGERLGAGGVAGAALILAGILVSEVGPAVRSRAARESRPA